jgi:hypothetical protein
MKMTMEKLNVEDVLIICQIITAWNHQKIKYK